MSGTRKKGLIVIALLAGLILVIGGAALTRAEGQQPKGALSLGFGTNTAFTYQGQLKQDGMPANGSFNFQFGLWDSDNGGKMIGSLVALSGVTVAQGLFTVQLDFGPGAFDGGPRWLAIAVAPSGGSSYTPLSSRQPLTAAPYALSLKPGALISTSASIGLSVVNSGGTSSPVAIFGQEGNPAMAALEIGAGVLGVTNDQIGVYGIGNTGRGVSGVSTGNYGVSGFSSSNDGVYGFSSSSTGVEGHGATGVMGSATLTGVLGVSTGGGNGVVGTANSGNSGVYGTSAGGFGVHGQSDSFAGGGVWGNSTEGTGVYGQSNSYAGVEGDTHSGYGVIGLSLNSTGSGVYARNSSATGTALEIDNGTIKVSGAGVSTTTPVFIWRATAASIGGVGNDSTFIDNPLTNGDPNAILIITHNYTASSPQNPNNHPIGVWYNGSKWAIYNEDAAAMTVGLAFNVLVIKS